MESRTYIYGSDVSFEIEDKQVKGVSLEHIHLEDEMEDDYLSTAKRELQALRTRQSFLNFLLLVKLFRYCKLKFVLT